VLTLLSETIRALTIVFAIQRRHGIYEVISHDSTVELLDPKGEEVVVTRLEEVRFLRDGTIAFYDTCWGDGELFAEYECSPGVPVDFFPDGFMHRVLISLRETKNHGEVLSFRIRRKILGGFRQAEEWWETVIFHPTRKLRVRIVFPRERLCQQATVTQRGKERTWSLDTRNFRFLADGRQELFWEVDRPPVHESYLIRWRW